jgi:ubiquinone/menaquinone biosynthesis C-methylase UbiE/uncharacterized protein YbaR (Trm112 family)
MIESLLELLRCPFCCGSFSLDVTNEAALNLGYYSLACHCGRYPVLAGIPVLKRGTISSYGHTAEALIAMIEAGRHRDALVSLLMPPPPARAEFAPEWIQALPSFRGMGRVKGLFGQSGLRSWMERGESLLMSATDQRTITEFLDFYFGHMGVYGSNNYTYFSFRLGQPRFLVALSLASVVRQPKKAILDLACGFGNVTRFLLRQAEGATVVGVDQNFFSLYVAKTWLAPGAHYVCATADISLPLADNSCSLTFCSDAFQLFMHQATCIRELKRLCGEEGVIALASVRNALVKKDLYSGSILPAQPPEGYLTMVADVSHRLIPDSAILDKYLKKEGPPLAAQPKAEDLRGVQWMSLIASRRSDVFRDHERFEEWPHIRGEHLGLNPRYKTDGLNAGGGLRLRRVFPSAWYEQENTTDNPNYLPESLSIGLQTVENLKGQIHTPDIERLIEQGVVLGVPTPYLDSNINKTISGIKPNRAWRRRQKFVRTGLLRKHGSQVTHG